MCRTRSAVVSCAGGRRDDVPAVSEDGRAVAHVEDLDESVAHEQDRDPAVAKPADDREQPRDLVGGERGRRLVQDEDARFQGQGLGDLDELLVGHRETPDRRPHVDLYVELVEQRLRRPARPAPVDRAEAPGRGVTDEHVLGDGQVRKEARLLVHDRDPERAGVGGAVDLRRLAVEQDGPAVGLIDAGEDLDQRALPGTVLADQRVDLARAKVHGDVGQGGGRPEPLGDATELDARRHGDGGRIRPHRRGRQRQRHDAAPGLRPATSASPGWPSSVTWIPMSRSAATIPAGASPSVNTPVRRSVRQNVAEAMRPHLV